MPNERRVGFHGDDLSPSGQQATSDQARAGADLYHPCARTQSTRFNQAVVNPPRIFRPPSLVAPGVQTEQRTALVTTKFRQRTAVGRHT